MTNIRMTKPGAGDKYFIRKANGGYSSCIQGMPTDPNCNVLANCVGYACGAFNEECNLGYEKYWLNCNAENFIERAIALGLSVVKEPVVGGILVWQKGATLSGNDGAGHVAICTSKNSDTQIRTAESGYGSTAFWTATRNKGNGSWGAGSGYAYRGCIVNPYIKDEPIPAPTPSGKFNIGDKVIIDGPLYVSSNASNPSGSVSNKITNITRKAEGTANPYNTTGDLGWIKEENIKAYEEPTPTPTPTPVKKEIVAGDTVIVSGVGTASSDGSGARTREFKNVSMKVIGISGNTRRPNRYALNQYNKGNVGDWSAVTAWFNIDSLKK